MARAFFLEASGGQRFCLFHPARAQPARAAVVYVPPFAEEMNKSRRMAALQARALAAAGCDVVQIDLLGCGDSSGTFGDARWAAWIADIHLAAAWLRQCSTAPLWFWSLRAGALLATRAAAELDQTVNFLFWQPTPSGKQFLQQFLRLKLAGDLIAGDAKGAMDALRQELNSGRPVEIAGYELAAELAHDLGSIELDLPENCGRALWLELVNRPDPDCSPVARSRVERWLARGLDATATAVSGPAFWQTAEIEDAPALIDATVAALTGTPSR